jgi:hypothetical protein
MSSARNGAKSFARIMLDFTIIASTATPSKDIKIGAYAIGLNIDWKFVCPSKKNNKKNLLRS